LLLSGLGLLLRVMHTTSSAINLKERKMAQLIEALLLIILCILVVVGGTALACRLGIVKECFDLGQLAIQVL
jgi:hypothetical protein